MAQGEWVQDAKHGYVTYTASNGDEYRGYYVQVLPWGVTWRCDSRSRIDGGSGGGIGGGGGGALVVLQGMLLPSSRAIRAAALKHLFLSGSGSRCVRFWR